MYGCESWTIKKAKHQRIDAFDLCCWRWLFPLDCKEIQPVNNKGNQSWIFIGRTHAVFWPPDVKNWLIGKDPDAGKDWGPEEGLTEDEMVRWHHLLYGYEFEQALEVGDGQGSLACCSPWVHKESDRTEPMNWTELKRGLRECGAVWSLSYTENGNVKCTSFHRNFNLPLLCDLSISSMCLPIRSLNLSLCKNVYINVYRN